LWAELANRLSGQGRPMATVVEGSDDAGLLNRRLGLTDHDIESPWTRRYPAVRGALGIVQPGLSAQSLRSQLNEVPIPPAAQSLRELFSVLTDMAQSDGSGTCHCRLAIGAGLTRALLASNTRPVSGPSPTPLSNGGDRRRAIDGGSREAQSNGPTRGSRDGDRGPLKSISCGIFAGSDPPADRLDAIDRQSRASDLCFVVRSPNGI
jgi:hypothetical protein